MRTSGMRSALANAYLQMKKINLEVRIGQCAPPNEKKIIWRYALANADLQMKGQSVNTVLAARTKPNLLHVTM